MNPQTMAVAPPRADLCVPGSCPLRPRGSLTTVPGLDSVIIPVLRVRQLRPRGETYGHCRVARGRRAGLQPGQLSAGPLGFLPRGHSSPLDCASSPGPTGPEKQPGGRAEPQGSTPQTAGVTTAESGVGQTASRPRGSPSRGTPASALLCGASTHWKPLPSPGFPAVLPSGPRAAPRWGPVRSGQQSRPPEPSPPGPRPSEPPPP